MTNKRGRVTVFLKDSALTIRGREHDYTGVQTDEELDDILSEFGSIISDVGAHLKVQDEIGHWWVIPGDVVMVVRFELHEEEDDVGE